MQKESFSSKCIQACFNLLNKKGFLKDLYHFTITLSLLSDVRIFLSEMESFWIWVQLIVLISCISISSKDVETAALNILWHELVQLTESTVWEPVGFLNSLLFKWERGESCFISKNSIGFFHASWWTSC